MVKRDIKNSYKMKKKFSIFLTIAGPIGYNGKASLLPKIAPKNNP